MTADFLKSTTGEKQVGLVNVMVGEMKAGNAKREWKIVTDVASYGKQLDRINDALHTVIALMLSQTDGSKLKQDDRRALENFSEMFKEIAAAKGDYKGRVAEHSRAVSRQLLPDHAGEDHSPLVSAWRAALESLTAVRRVVFPLEEAAFCFDSDEVSHGARLWTNVLGLMLAHAWLEQRNRDVVELGSGERAVVATPADYEAAYLIFQATCDRSVVNLSETHRKILDAVHDLEQLPGFADGFSLRKIAERAGIHHSTVAEHKTYLVKSARLLREAEGGGLALVTDAEPSWWRKGDALVGFPRPEQVRRWWEGSVGSASESARQARHHAQEHEEPHTYAEKGVGQATRQTADSTRHPNNGGGDARVSGGQTPVSDSTPDSENRIPKRETVHESTLSGVSGGFEEGERHSEPVSFDLRPGETATVEELRARRASENEERLTLRCIHGYEEGKGCYLCDPEHPYRIKTGSVS